MPDQGHLYVGVRAKSAKEAYDTLVALGADIDISEGEAVEDALWEDPCCEKEVEYKGRAHSVHVSFVFDDSGMDGFVGFRLTSRYSPAVLDEGMEHGREEPFIVDVEGITDILRQVRSWWPEAQLILWTQCF